MYNRLRTLIGRFTDKKDGAVAIEFALILPIMLTLYLGTMEISQAIEANKKVGRSASLIGDLVTQQAVFTKTELGAVADLGAAVLQPYNRATPTVEMIGIQVNNDTPPKATVAWSLKKTGGASSRMYAPGSPITIPPRLLLRNTFIIRAAVTVKYLPITAWTITDTTSGINMDEEYYLRPRASFDVICTDC